MFNTSSSSSLSGTKPQPPHVGHRCSSSVPLSTTPSPLQSGQVFICPSTPPKKPPADAENFNALGLGSPHSTLHSQEPGMAQTMRIGCRCGTCGAMAHEEELNRLVHGRD